MNEGNPLGGLLLSPIGELMAVRHSYFLFILSYFFFSSASPVRGGGKISDFAGGVHRRGDFPTAY